MWDGVCRVCRVAVRPGEGIVEADPRSWRGWAILCPEHMPSAGALEAPKPPEASRLRSIHLDEEKYER